MIVQHYWGPLAAAFVALSTLQGPQAIGADWTGLYIGAQAGASRADLDTQQLGDFDTTRAAFGGHLGYNLGLGMVVVGAEADAAYAHSSAGFATSGGGTLNINTTWNGSVRGRAGVTIGPALFYATAGWAWSAVSTLERTSGGTSLKSSGAYDGVVYGLGAEAYLLPPVSFRFEALRYDYGSNNLSLSGGAASLMSVDRSDAIVRAGVTLHFK